MLMKRRMILSIVKQNIGKSIKEKKDAHCKRVTKRNSQRFESFFLKFTFDKVLSCPIAVLYLGPVHRKEGVYFDQ